MYTSMDIDIDKEVKNIYSFLKANYPKYVFGEPAYGSTSHFTIPITYKNITKRIYIGYRHCFIHMTGYSFYHLFITEKQLPQYVVHFNFSNYKTHMQEAMQFMMRDHNDELITIHKNEEDKSDPILIPKLYAPFLTSMLDIHNANTNNERNYLLCSEIKMDYERLSVLKSFPQQIEMDSIHKAVLFFEMLNELGIDTRICDIQLTVSVSLDDYETNELFKPIDYTYDAVRLNILKSNNGDNKSDVLQIVNAIILNKYPHLISKLSNSEIEDVAEILCDKKLAKQLISEKRITREIIRLLAQSAYHTDEILSLIKENNDILRTICGLASQINI